MLVTMAPWSMLDGQRTSQHIWAWSRMIEMSQSGFSATQISACVCVWLMLHTHTQSHTYIYIYIWCSTQQTVMIQLEKSIFGMWCGTLRGQIHPNSWGSNQFFLRFPFCPIIYAFWWADSPKIEDPICYMYAIEICNLGIGSNVRYSFHHRACGDMSCLPFSKSGSRSPLPNVTYPNGRWLMMVNTPRRWVLHPSYSPECSLIEAYLMMFRMCWTHFGKRH